MSIPTKIREALKERADGCCEICGVGGATNAHHRRNKSQGGPDVLSNLMLLCGSGTTGCHGKVTGYPQWATSRGYTIQGRVDGEAPETVPVDIRGRRSLLDDDGSVVPLPAGEFPAWMTPGRSA